jgi:hypothetical protein
MLSLLSVGLILEEQALNRYNRLGEYDKQLAKKMGGAALYGDVSAEVCCFVLRSGCRSNCISIRCS